MAREVTLRLPDATADRLEAAACAAGQSVDEIGARAIEEALRQEELPGIEFRTFNGERHACVEGAMQIWQLVMNAEGWNFDVQTTAKYFPIAPYPIEAAFNYYRAYPEEIDRALAENRSWTYERLKQVLPQIELFTVPRDADDVDPLAS